MISKSHLVEERTRSCLMMLHDSNEEKITQGSIRRPAAQPARQPRPALGLPGQAFGAEICGGLMCVKVLVYAAGDALLFTFGWDH